MDASEALRRSSGGEVSTPGESLQASESGGLASVPKRLLEGHEPSHKSQEAVEARREKTASLAQEGTATKDWGKIISVGLVGVLLSPILIPAFGFSLLGRAAHKSLIGVGAAGGGLLGGALLSWNLGPGVTAIGKVFGKNISGPKAVTGGSAIGGGYVVGAGAALGLAIPCGISSGLSWCCLEALEKAGLPPDTRKWMESWVVFNTLKETAERTEWANPILKWMT